MLDAGSVVVSCMASLVFWAALRMLAIDIAEVGRSMPRGLGLKSFFGSKVRTRDCFGVVFLFDLFKSKDVSDIRLVFLGVTSTYWKEVSCGFSLSFSPDTPSSCGLISLFMMNKFIVSLCVSGLIGVMTSLSVEIFSWLYSGIYMLVRAFDFPMILTSDCIPRTAGDTSLLLFS